MHEAVGLDNLASAHTMVRGNWVIAAALREFIATRYFARDGHGTTGRNEIATGTREGQAAPAEEIAQ